MLFLSMGIHFVQKEMKQLLTKCFITSTCLLRVIPLIGTSSLFQLRYQLLLFSVQAQAA